MISTVDITTFIARHADGATVIDCREPGEYVTGHVPGATLAPMSQISHHVGDISRERDVYVICQSGNRSATVTEFLVRAGVSAHSVSGGTSGWNATGQPVVTGTRPR